MEGDKNSLLSLFTNVEHNHLLTDSGFSPHARPSQVTVLILQIYSEGGYVTEPGRALYCKHSFASFDNQ